MSPRKSSSNHKQEIFEQARQLMRLQGYHRTSIADIANACDLSKASIYHHIAEKKDLVGITMNEIQKFFKETCFDAIEKNPEPMDKKVELLFQALESYLEKYQGGCLVHNLVHELADSQPEFLSLFQNYFSLWISSISKILTQRYSAEKANRLAEDLVSQLAGAIMLDRLYRTQTHVQRVKALLLSYVTEEALEAA